MASNPSSSSGSSTCSGPSERVAVLVIVVVVEVLGAVLVQTRHWYQSAYFETRHYYQWIKPQLGGSRNGPRLLALKTVALGTPLRPH